MTDIDPNVLKAGMVSGADFILDTDSIGDSAALVAALGEIGRSVEALNEAIATIAAAQQRQAAADSAIISAVKVIAANFNTSRNPHVVSMLRHLYWKQPAVSSVDLAKAAGFRSPGELTMAIGSIRSGIPCTDCGDDLPRTSRSWKPKYYNEFFKDEAGRQVRTVQHPACEPCIADRNAERDERYKLARRRENYRNNTLLDIPLPDALAIAMVVNAYPPITLNMSQDEAKWHGFWAAFDVAEQLLTQIAEGTYDSLGVRIPDAVDLLAAADRAVRWNPVAIVELLESTIISDPIAVILDRVRRDLVSRREEAAVEANRLHPGNADW